MLKLGWKAGPEQYQPDELLDYAIAAENAGFESLDVSDHFIHGPGRDTRALPGRGWAPRP